jgi:hypothetical protein
MTAFKAAESMKHAELSELFSDVYAGEEPWNIVRGLLLIVLGNAHLLSSANRERNWQVCSINTALLGSRGNKN